MGRLDLPDPHRDEDESRISLWFITPAHGRSKLAAICFEQHARVHVALSKLGIDSTSCVIASDENLDLARAQGFVTIERDNEHLGAKFNDGYEAAARAGADYAMPIGSDDWIDPALIPASIPGPDEIGAHRDFASMRADGQKLATLRVDYPGGNGIRVMPMRLLAHLDYRPAAERRARSIDGSIQQRLARSVRGRGRRLDWRYTDLHPLQTVGFQSLDEQLTRYGNLVSDHLIKEHDSGFALLSKHYPLDLVLRMRSRCAEVAAS
jgi:hypothetical protein